MLSFQEPLIIQLEPIGSILQLSKIYPFGGHFHVMIHTKLKLSFSDHVIHSLHQKIH